MPAVYEGLDSKGKETFKQVHHVALVDESLVEWVSNVSVWLAEFIDS